MKRMKWLMGCTAVTAILALPAVAGAHVAVLPDQDPAKALVVENVHVPNEQDDASTTKVSVQLPPGFAEVSFAPVPGWKVAVKKTKLAEPITTDEGDKLTEQVSQVTWSGGKIGPGAFDVDDCAGTFAELSARGVTFLSEPAERPYGIEATLRDNSGNWFSMTERPRERTIS